MSEAVWGSESLGLPLSPAAPVHSAAVPRTVLSPGSLSDLIAVLGVLIRAPCALPSEASWTLLLLLRA